MVALGAGLTFDSLHTITAPVVWRRPLAHPTGAFFLPTTSGKATHLCDTAISGARPEYASIIAEEWRLGFCDEEQNRTPT